MLFHRLYSDLLRPIVESAPLFLAVLIALGLGVLAHFSQTAAPSSFWIRATVQAVEISAFLTALLVAATLILRAFRLFRSEWRRTFRAKRG